MDGSDNHGRIFDPGRQDIQRTEQGGQGSCTPLGIHIPSLSPSHPGDVSRENREDEYEHIRETTMHGGRSQCSAVSQGSHDCRSKEDCHLHSSLPNEDDSRPNQSNSHDPILVPVSASSGSRAFSSCNRGSIGGGIDGWHGTCHTNGESSAERNRETQEVSHFDDPEYVCPFNDESVEANQYFVHEDSGVNHIDIDGDILLLPPILIAAAAAAATAAGAAAATAPF